MNTPESRRSFMTASFTASSCTTSSVMTSRAVRARAEAAGLLRTPQRILPLIWRLACDRLRTSFEYRHLYSYSSTTIPTSDALQSVIAWILAAQRCDGGIAAYYSLLTGYSESYPEVTGYIIPTLYDFARLLHGSYLLHAAERATQWLLALQMPSGAFFAGLHRSESEPGAIAQPSVFNTGQILQGLVRTHAETGNAEILCHAIAAGDWLATIQQSDGSWSGSAAYQGVAHTYYSMVAWSLAQLAAVSNSSRHAVAADKNIDWVIAHIKPNGWIDGINLREHPAYLHFIAYVIQGALECGIARRRDDAIEAAAKPAWVLLQKFEIHKRLLGSYEADFKGGRRFTCLTGNAQMSCVWLRLFEVTRDLRYLNAALKMNEMLKHSIALKARRGRGRGIAGGVAGSCPIWGPYQPMRFISWGCKFLADALMLEQRLTSEFEEKFDEKTSNKIEAAECA
jgi:hypothetical protein